MLLRNPRGGEACRILHANMAGHATLYNADTRSVVAVPDLGESKGFKPIPFAVAGTGAGEESLYLMRVPVPRTPLIFEVLRFDGGSSSRSKLLMDLDPTNSLRWHPLPRPPPLRGDGCFGSSTVVGSSACRPSETATAPSASTRRAMSGGTPATRSCRFRIEPSTSPSSTRGSASPPTTLTTRAPRTSPASRPWPLPSWHQRRTTSGKISACRRRRSHRLC